MNFYNILLVGCGGFLGSVARYLTAQTIDSRLNSVVPFGTFAVNVAGSFILGVIYGVLLTKTNNPQHMRLFLATGFCGGFTTFSAFAFENMGLIQQKMIGTSLFYVMLSLVLGVLAVWAGVMLGKSLG
jgi:fluoride exporter